MKKVAIAIFLAIWVCSPSVGVSQTDLCEQTISPGFLLDDFRSGDFDIQSILCLQPNWADWRSYYIHNLNFPTDPLDIATSIFLSYWGAYEFRCPPPNCPPWSRRSDCPYFPQTGTTRFEKFLNAAFLIDYVDAHRLGFDAWKNQKKFSWNMSWVFPNSPEGWLSCCLDCPCEYACNPSEGPNFLCPGFFYTNHIAIRAATIVHEASHEQAGHTCNRSVCWLYPSDPSDPFSPRKVHCDSPECQNNLSTGQCVYILNCKDYCARGASCDDYFGENNANTHEVEFLADAVGTYRRNLDMSTGPLDGSLEGMPIAGYLGLDPSGKRICGYLPLLSQDQRYASRNRAEHLLAQSFSIDYTTIGMPLSLYGDCRDCAISFGLSAVPYGSCTYLIDFHNQWPCEGACDPSSYIYPAGGNACNEDMNHANFDINWWNWSKCFEANSRIDDGSTAEERKAVLDWLHGPEGLRECAIGVDQNYLKGQCAGVIDSSSNVDELISKWSDELEKYDVYNPQAQMKACVSEFCKDKLGDPVSEQNAHAFCYEWNDQFGCLDEMCGSLWLTQLRYGEESKEYFGVVKCRESYFDPEAGLPSVSFGTACDQEYARCVIDRKYEGWLEARRSGTCSLGDASNPGTAAPAGVGPIKPILNLKYFATYEDFKAAYPKASIDECSAAFSLCEENSEKAVQAAAEFVHVTTVPRAVAEKLDLPDPSPIEFVSKFIDRYSKKLAEIAVSSPDENSVITPENARQQIASVPEVMHSVSRFMGMNTFFALFGTAARESIFGSSVVSLYQDTDFKPLEHYTPAQRVILPSLKAIRDLRLKLSSPETTTILRTAATSVSQETFFNFVRAATHATTAGEFDILVNDLANEMP